MSRTTGPIPDMDGGNDKDDEGDKRTPQDKVQFDSFPWVESDCSRLVDMKLRVGGNGDGEGKRAHEYILEEAIGYGGMACVYKSHDRAGHPVAVKVLKREYTLYPLFAERFRTEAQAMAALDHPNIARFIEYGEFRRAHFIVMEYVEGPNLGQLLPKWHSDMVDIPPAPAIDLNDTLHIVRQVLAALRYAHMHGITHRDIKPENVLLSADGQRIKLTDFGIAKLADNRTLTETGQAFGTTSYFSPQQAAGEPIDHRTDIYSLGVMLYEMVTGRLPFIAGDAVAVAVMHIREPLENPRVYVSSLPDYVERAIIRALEKEPGKRFPDAASMASALRIPLDPLPGEVSSQLSPFMNFMESIKLRVQSLVKYIQGQASASSHPPPPPAVHVSPVLARAIPVSETEPGYIHVGPVIKDGRRDVSVPPVPAVHAKVQDPALALSPRFGLSNGLSSPPPAQVAAPPPTHAVTPELQSALQTEQQPNPAAQQERTTRVQRMYVTPDVTKLNFGNLDATMSIAASCSVITLSSTPEEGVVETNTPWLSAAPDSFGQVGGISENITIQAHGSKLNVVGQTYKSGVEFFLREAGERKIIPCQARRVSGVDLLFILDGIGDDATIEDRIKLIKESVEQAQSVLSTRGTLRFGALVYGDRNHHSRDARNEEAPIQLIPLTSQDYFEARIGPIKADSIDRRLYDFDSAFEEAVLRINDAAWREDAHHVLVTLGGRPPHALEPNTMWQIRAPMKRGMPGEQTWSEEFLEVAQANELFSFCVQWPIYWPQASQVHVPPEAKNYAEDCFRAIGYNGIWLEQDTTSIKLIEKINARLTVGNLRYELPVPA
jgi:serine/threonine protein kinase